MKFTAVFAAAAIAMVGSVAAQDCTSAQQTAAFVSLSSLLSGSDLADCASASGYNMLQATSTPTDEQTKKMCGIQACKSLIATVKGKNPPNCVLVIPTSGAKMNVYNLANEFEPKCAAFSTTPAPATTAPSTPAPATPSTPSTPSSTPSAGTPTTTPAPTKVAC
jgi:hypothetical protein